MENTDNIKLFADNAPSIVAIDPRVGVIMPRSSSTTMQTIWTTVPEMWTTIIETSIIVTVPIGTTEIMATTILGTTLAPIVPPLVTTVSPTVPPVIGTTILPNHINTPKNMLGEFVYLNSESKVDDIDLVFYGELSESSRIEFDIFRMYMDGTLIQSDQKYEEEEDIEYTIVSINNEDVYCGSISLNEIDGSVLKKQHKLSLSVNSFGTYLVDSSKSNLLNIERGYYSCAYSKHKITIKTTTKFGSSEILEFNFCIFINSRNSTSSERYIVPISKEDLFYCYKSEGNIKSGKLEGALPDENIDDNLMIISFGYGKGKYNAEFFDNLKLLYTTNHRIIDLIAPNAISIFVEKANEVKNTDFVYVTDYVYVSDNKVNYDKELIYSNTEITSGEYNYAIKGSFSSDKFPYNIAIQLPENYEDSILQTELVEPFKNTDYKSNIIIPDTYNLASKSLMYAKLDEIIKINSDTTKIMKIKVNKDYVGGLLSINNKDGNALRVRTDKKVSISPNFIGSDNKEDLKKEISYKFTKNVNPVKEENKSRNRRSLSMENTDNIKLFADNAPSIVAIDPRSVNSRNIPVFGSTISITALSPTIIATTAIIGTTILGTTLAPTVPPLVTTVSNSKFKIKYSIIDSAITHKSEMLNKVHSINTTLPLSTIDKSLYPFETEQTQLISMTEILEKPSNIQILNPITHLNVVLIIDKLNNKFYILFEDSDNKLFKYEFSGIYNLSIASMIGTILDNDGFNFKDSDKNIYDITLSESGIEIRSDSDLSNIYYSAIYDLI